MIPKAIVFMQSLNEGLDEPCGLLSGNSGGLMNSPSMMHKLTRPHSMTPHTVLEIFKGCLECCVKHIIFYFQDKKTSTKSD